MYTMRITKYGHCCLRIETKGRVILIDPGAWSTLQNDARHVDCILITHEHADHFHIESLKEILRHNQQAKVFTNSGVASKLREESIAFELLENGDFDERLGFLIESVEGAHQEIYEELGRVQNTGYFIDGDFFYPGDSFTIPNKKVNILAAPIVAPWATLRQCIDYIKSVNPKYAIPVHDGMLRKDTPGPTYRVPPQILEPLGITFEIIQDGESKEFN